MKKIILTGGGTAGRVRAERTERDVRRGDGRSRLFYRHPHRHGLRCGPGFCPWHRSGAAEQLGGGAPFLPGLGSRREGAVDRRVARAGFFERLQGRSPCAG